MSCYGHAHLLTKPALAMVGARNASAAGQRIAGEYGGEVMAVPGSPLDPRCHGSNHLIRTGAALIETVDDIMEAVRPLIENMALKTPDQKTPRHQKTAPGPVSDAIRRKITEL